MNKVKLFRRVVMRNNLKNCKLGDVFDLYDNFESKHKVIHEDGDYMVIKEYNDRNTNYFSLYNKKLRKRRFRFKAIFIVIDVM